jgi:isoquinoline 1-oxidoreductase
MKEQEPIGENIHAENEKLILKRRDFFKYAGAGVGGLYVFFKSASAFGFMAETAPEKRSLSTDYNAFLRIEEDGSVSCFTGKIEMGQGVITSLAQMLADELDVAFDKVKMVMGDTDLCPYDAGTWGSLSVRVFGPAMLAAAAEARAVLLSLGAEHLKASLDQLSVKEGVIFVKDQKNAKVSYAELTKGKRIEKFQDVDFKPKDFSEYKIMGKSILRTDALSKVKGEALYAGDYRLPGMLYAKILRPPSHGATLVSADTAEARKLEGAFVIEEKEIVAVLHEDPEKAEKALRTIKAEYTFDEKIVDDKSIFDYLLNAKAEGKIINDEGNLADGKSAAKDIFENSYYDGYVAHAPIETHTALAFMEEDKIVAIVSTQSPFGVQDMICRELGLPLEKVRIITPFVGGAFGGKAPARQALEAARLTKLSGKPVMVYFSREEEFFYDTFRPANVIKISSGMDDQANISLWDYHVYFAGSRGSDTVYDVPNQRTTSYSAQNVHPFGTGAWRAPGNSNNTFARECQIDIMAAKAGMDPLEFRLKNLKDERMIGVLKACAELFGWKPTKTASGTGYGIACGIDAGSYVALMAEVKVDEKTGKVEVVRVACTQDMGFCVNPHGAIMQIEGCVMMGLGYALTEEIMFTGGDIKTSNYGTYKIPLFSWMPKIDSLILDKKEPMQGGGEPAIICMGGVIANAVYDACVARVFHMPITPERILEAIANRY